MFKTFVRWLIPVLYVGRDRSNRPPLDFVWQSVTSRQIHHQTRQLIEFHLSIWTQNFEEIMRYRLLFPGYCLSSSWWFRAFRTVGRLLVVALVVQGVEHWPGADCSDDDSSDARTGSGRRRKAKWAGWYQKCAWATSVCRWSTNVTSMIRSSAETTTVVAVVSTTRAIRWKIASSHSSSNKRRSSGRSSWRGAFWARTTTTTDRARIEAIYHAKGLCN